MKLKAMFSVAAVASASVFGPLPVAHAQTKAALTRDIDRPTAQPVSGKCSTFSSFGLDSKCIVYTVPAGKRLVVETVGYYVSVPSASPIFPILFGADKGSSSLSRFDPDVYSVTPVAVLDYVSFRYYGGTQALTFYLDELKSLAGYISASSTGSREAIFNFSGYLVDK